MDKQKSRPRRRWRWARRAGAAALVLVASLYVAGEIYRRRDPAETLLARRDVLREAREHTLEREGRLPIRVVELTGERGLVVRGWLRLPPSPGPHAALVILGGQRTGKKTVDYIAETHPFALLGLDYPHERGPRPEGVVAHLREGLELHTAVLDTVPAVMLAIDYLVGCDDIDAERIGIVGGSLGALFAPAAAALDERVAALALLFGAGDIGAVVRTNLHWFEPAASVGGWLVAVLAAPIEPLEHIGAVAPRPVFMLNGHGDERMPVALARRLQESAGEPLTVRWMDLGHVNIRDTRFHSEILNEVLIWLETAL